MDLRRFFGDNPRVAIAFSGGADSSYLLYAAKAAGCEVRAYFMKSQFQPKSELYSAGCLADSIGVPMTVGTLDALGDPAIVQNSPDRCYHCKNAILRKIWELARADGFAVLCDGTNADDNESDRPGFRAQREQGVVSPLRECGLKKADIRRLSYIAGLLSHDKPSYSCLATRIPVGTAITQAILDKIESAEEALSCMGFSDFRVRFVPPCSARLQFPDSQWDEAAARRIEILETFQALFESTALDLYVRGHYGAY